jgi:LPS-assembly lipoprotein
MIRAVKQITVIYLACVISACGFQLRGDVQVSKSLLPLHIAAQGPVELRDEIQSLLRSSGIALTDNAALAAATLSIQNAQRSRRVLSVDARGRAREYEISYVVSYRISTAETINRAVRLSRELIFDPDSVLALDYETRTLYQDMRRDAARLILQQLQAVK